MDPYLFVLTGFGGVVLLTAWLPMLLKELPLSLPIVCVALGALAAWLAPGSAPHPIDQREAVERLTEITVVISLMGAGLKLDRRLGWSSWVLTWRMLGLAMPLTILGLALLAHALLGVGAASALLLAACLAPTDPVLASDVQVGPPGEGEEDEVRFTLTSEAGLNDGLAFPFVVLAVAVATYGTGLGKWTLEWFVDAVLWRIAAGVGAGWALGRALGWLTFKMPNRARLSRTGDGFVALGITALVYGLTEAVHGYGFLAVFVAALALRSAERGHDYHQKLHDFAEELERLLMMVLLVLFGASLAKGGLLDALTPAAAVFAALAILVVRPLSGLVGLAGTPRPLSERAVIGFFGIRGLGSFYYLAYATEKGAFPEAELLWSTTGLVVLASVLLHGATVTPVIRGLDRRRRRKKGGVPAAEGAAQGKAEKAAEEATA